MELSRLLKDFGFCIQLSYQELLIYYSAVHKKTQPSTVKRRILTAALLLGHPALLLADPPPGPPIDGVGAKAHTVGVPIAAYPARFALPASIRAATISAAAQADHTAISDSESSTAMAAYAFSRPPSPEEYLVYLRELEEVPFFTLWEGDSSRIFFGLDDDHHPGLHFSPRRD